MTKVICCPREQLPERLDPEVLYITLFSSTAQGEVGHVALDLPRNIRRAALAPSVSAWDFAVIASAVAAADKAILRKDSADGWTRIIDMSIFLAAPLLWNAKRLKLESILRFLTGDFWRLRFLDGGPEPPKAKVPKKRYADCVCLLSGGIDSLIGAINLAALGKRPLFVSQVVRGDRDTQLRIATALGGSERHFQWSFAVKHPGASEKSTRARSIVFFAFAALAASAISSNDQQPVNIVVPENGFISLNVPLGPGRMGSLSTKTTHPVYMAAIQELWNAVGINARLIFPFQDKTKGELLMKYSDDEQLINLIPGTTSCGKYQRHNLTHCGECVPCLVRRAAFIKAGLHDTTAGGYRCNNLKYSDSKDVAAAANAYIRYKDDGIRRFTGGALSFASHADRQQYEGVVSRGIEELGLLLFSHGVL